jgi:hypothetical protein
MKNSRIWRVAASIAAVAFGGCATIFTGTTDDLAFDANVPDVLLSIDGEVQGQLPLSIKMSRNFVGGRRFVAKFEKPGYATQQFELKREFNTVAILDISSTLISGGVDVLTGSLMKFSPREYHVLMVEAEAAPSKAELQRTRDLYRFALTNYRDLQKDVARGGGDHLAAFAWLICAGEVDPGRLVVDEAVSHGPSLVSASTAPAFAREFDGMLAGSVALRPYRLDRNVASKLRPK